MSGSQMRRPMQVKARKGRGGMGWNGIVSGLFPGRFQEVTHKTQHTRARDDGGICQVL
jgi:hypothetical protein